MFVEMPGRRCKLYARLFRPKAVEEGIKAKILFLHGVGEHIGRYENRVFEEFANRGIAVLAFDLKGFGRSCTIDAEKSPKRGEMLHADGPKDGEESLLCDIKFFWDLLLQVEGEKKGIPQFLMGHSMGGLLALLCGMQENIALFKDLSGIIVSAPALGVAYHVPKAKLLAVKVLGSLFSTVCLDNPIGMSHSYVFEHALSIKWIDPSHISRVSDVVEAFKNDPLNHCRLSLGSAKLILGLTQKVRESAKNLKIPALFLCHGTSDLLTSCDASNDFFQSLISDNVPDKTFSSPEGFYHECKGKDYFKYCLCV